MKCLLKIGLWKYQVSLLDIWEICYMLSGNPWRGMVYGMTVRYPWFTEGVTSDPRDIWKVWDDFGIAESKMIGYWERNPVVFCSREDVMATAYVKEGKVLLSVASWASETVNVNLDLDWEAVGLDKGKVRFIAPKIEDFQPERTFSINEEIPIEPTKGWLLIVE
ncbi:glycoside hydrolase domain-containing protein [Antarcticibacterium sp. 1MA-6-2]|uniref:glycoside hydrolase domain-containing protein n=1 Tax=Antarcticibacterium sp. 1MA-6-2 TaxID=2908210 RepID=UPI0021037E44|nr:glycoside hydrolase domain-containing protein [Antarcticibacterium sp. 1MA-6-2]